MNILGTSLSELLASKITSEEVVSFFDDRRKKHNKTLNVYLHEDSISTEVKPDRKKAALKGMPLAFKDNIATLNHPTTAASKVLENFNSPFAATITHKLAESGATIYGKVNMDAWAHGSSTETSDYGATLNPYNTEYVPGGSSGGSAAAVAVGLAPAAIGTETAGSIRLPASWSGVVGLKPTYGRVSRHGIVAMGSSWDCPGPMTQTVEDAALLLQIMAGHDEKDATTYDKPVPDYTAALKTKRKLTIGISDEYLSNLQPEVAEAMDLTISILEKMGHTIKKISLMDPKYAISVYMLLQRSEVSSNLSRYDGIRYGNNRSFFGEEAERRIMLGTYALSSGYYDAYYKKATKVRSHIAQDFLKTFENVDLIVAPTAPTTASKLGDSDSYAFYGEQMDILTEPASAAGIPAISIPYGLDKKGLPIGIQLMANILDEETLLNGAHFLEKEFAFPRIKVMQKYE